MQRPKNVVLFRLFLSLSRLHLLALFFLLCVLRHVAQKDIKLTKGKPAAK